MNLSNIITKKSVLFISLVGTAALFVPFWFDLYSYCFQQGRCADLWDFFETIVPFLLLFLPIFILSIITYFLREEVFRAWLHFAYWWIPLSVLFVYLAKDGGGGGGFGIPDLLDPGFVALVFSFLLAVISLVIIVVKSLLLRGK